MLHRQWALFAAISKGQVLPPYEVLIHPSSGCNLRCDWCIGDHVPIEVWDDEGESLSLLDASKEAPERLPDTLANPDRMMKLIRGIVDYRKTGTYRSGETSHTAEFRVHNVSFSGLIGEPLVARTAVVTAMNYLVDNGLRVGIFTNGVLMDDKVIDVFTRIAYVNVSLDAATGETYAALKFQGRRAGVAKFERAVGNLEQLVEGRRENSESTLEIGVSFILYPENFHEVYEAARLVREIGVDRLRLKRDISGNKLLDDRCRRLAEEQIARIRNELVDDNFQLIEVHKLSYLEDLNRSFHTCSITDMMAAVGSDGHLYPCNYHPRPGGASFGSAVDASFQAVWEGAERMRLRGDLPGICPKVCDPFKNRANRLLATARDIVTAYGLDHLERDVHRLLISNADDSGQGR